MGKLGKQSAKLQVESANKKAGLIRTSGGKTTTHEGGTGHLRDTKSELFLLGVTNMVSEQTFYERGSDRDKRFMGLLITVTHQDADWVSRFLPWLRGPGNMRTASIVGAAVYARTVLSMAPEAREALYRAFPGATVRKVVASVLQRPDEPAEFISYWLQGSDTKTLPGGVQRGLADAVKRLYTERNSLKYDGQNQPWRMSDVIQLVHPDPDTEVQSLLFDYLAKKRFSGSEAVIPDELLMLQANRKLYEIPQELRRERLAADPKSMATILRSGGMTWESLATWLGGPLGKEGWEAIAPSLGIFALVRNLRNISEAGVSNEVQEALAAKISDPQVIANSRMFPLRFYTAYREATNVIWSYPLEKALMASLGNIPKLDGRTLVLIDQSGSMNFSMSNKSTVRLSEQAALFGIALGMAADNADVYVYGNSHKEIPLPKGGSILPLVAKYGQADMGGTQTWTTARSLYRGHDRIVIVTDEQSHDSAYGIPDIPIVTFNVEGYKAAHTESSKKRITVGGLSDGGFSLIQAMDSAGKGEWPF
jgi:TROVE domain.